jgi:hypothetical protein
MRYYTEFEVGDWVRVADDIEFDTIESGVFYYVGHVRRGTSGQLVSLYTDSSKTVLIGGTMGNKAMYFTKKETSSNAPGPNPYVHNIKSNGGIANTRFRFVVIDPHDQYSVVTSCFKTIEDAEDFVKTEIVEENYSELDIYQFIRRGKLPADLVWEV